MKTWVVLSAVLLPAAGLAAFMLNQKRQAERAGPVEHVRREFSFTVHAPMPVVAPLFGANAERMWAPDWNPEYVYPAVPADIEGAVFRIAHGHGLHRLHATWINTIFDLAGGHVQYVYLIEGRMIVRIDIHISAPDAKTTAVRVAYERTALTSAANEHVRSMARDDAAAGPDWQAQIEAALRKAGSLD
jgi:hypothetical protein